MFLRRLVPRAPQTSRSTARGNPIAHCRAPFARLILFRHGHSRGLELKDGTKRNMGGLSARHGQKLPILQERLVLCVRIRSIASHRESLQTVTALAALPFALAIGAGAQSTRQRRARQRYISYRKRGRRLAVCKAWRPGGCGALYDTRCSASADLLGMPTTCSDNSKLSRARAQEENADFGCRTSPMQAQLEGIRARAQAGTGSSTLAEVEKA